MSRYFTVREAESLLPEVERALREAMAAKKDLDSAEAQLQTLTRHIAQSGGTVVDPGRFLGPRRHRAAAAARLKSAAEEITELGCLLKDLDTGLVDFPTLYRGEEVLLCWKAGEPRIAYWHRTQEGFQGRKPVDQEFLSAHRGGTAG